MAVGGIIQCSISNPDAGTKFFNQIKDDDSMYELVGFTNENTVDAAGNLITNMQPKGGTMEMTSSNDPTNALPELEFLQLCMNSLSESTIRFQCIGGWTYAGSGRIEGNPQLSGSKLTVQFKVMSGQGFTLQ
jgi:hypothetical protein